MRKVRLALMMAGTWCMMLFAGLALGQGSLTPPGAPAPTMRTLQEIEPRVPITNAAFTITQSGSYYLVTNLTGIAGTNGITIISDDVTLDLNGFALVGISGSLNGIQVSGTRNNIAIRNGIVRDWGGHGVDAYSALQGNYIDLQAYTNGDRGLRLGSYSVVSRCSAKNNTSWGISVSSYSTVSDCVSSKNADDGFFISEWSGISDCVSTFNGGDGFYISNYNQIKNCNACENGGNGIYANFYGTILDCKAIDNDGDGINVTRDCEVLNNSCHGNGYGAGTGAGIHATDSDNRIESNNLTDNANGIDVDVGGNLIVRNSASGNTTSNYVISGTQTIGPIISTTGTITTNNPWANFEF